MNFETVKDVFQNGGVIEITGPSACGKSRLVLEYLEAGNMDYLRLVATSCADAGFVLGQYVFQEGDAVFQEAPFAVALRQEDKVVILEEYDLLEDSLFNDVVLPAIAEAKGVTILIRTDMEAEKPSANRFEFLP